MIITAIIAVRNEERYLPVTLQQLVDDGIQIAIVDHASGRETQRIYGHFDSRIVHLDHLPYRGHFSLADQLAAKARIMASICSDWFIHQDADEILQSPNARESLRNGIERVAAEGATAIHFSEFVFVPTQQSPEHEHGRFNHTMLHYYLFEPGARRLVRAWKNQPGVRQIGAGHRIAGNSELCYSDEVFLLRHYIFLSHRHAAAKYAQRTFAPDEIAKRWHWDRARVPNCLSLPNESELHSIASWEDKRLLRTRPRMAHFWLENWNELDAAE